MCTCGLEKLSLVLLFALYDCFGSFVGWFLVPFVVGETSEIKQNHKESLKIKDPRKTLTLFSRSGPESNLEQLCDHDLL